MVSQIDRSIAIRSEDLVAQRAARQRDECVRQIRAVQVEIDDVHIQGPKSVQHLRDLRETVHLEDRLALAGGGSYFMHPGKAAEAAIRQLPAIGQLMRGRLPPSEITFSRSPSAISLPRSIRRTRSQMRSASSM